MKDEPTNILRASTSLVSAIKTAGEREHFGCGSTLFATDDENDGLFLIVSGEVCLSVRGLPKLNRIFSAGSILGLPATFTGMLYSLGATAVTDCEVVHVSRGNFLKLMQEHPHLCGETTVMLCHETSFIQAALAEQRRCVGVAS